MNMPVQWLPVDPYKNGSFVPRLRHNGLLFMSDYDGTQTTGSKEPSAQELSDRAAGLAIADEAGAVTVGVSARTPGLMMSRKAFEASLAYGYREHEPRWKKNPVTGRQEYVDLAEVPFFAHNLDWDILASLGKGILVKNGTGYVPDTLFEEMVRYDYLSGNDFSILEVGDPAQAAIPWRQAAMAFLREKCSEAAVAMADIEFPSKYIEGKADVWPLDYRIQFTFHGKKGLAKLLRVRRVIEEEKKKGNRLALRLQLVDESKLHPDLEECVYTLYLMPWMARKENMINRLLSHAADAAGKMTQDLRVFFAGDTLTDLYAGLYGGGAAEMKFLLATGSRLAPYLINRSDRYGTEDLSFLWSVRGRSRCRLCPTEKKGEYVFVCGGRGGRVNTIVIGDEAYPRLSPPGSVAQFLRDYL